MFGDYLLILECQVFFLTSEQVIRTGVATDVQDAFANLTDGYTAINDRYTVVVLCLLTMSHHHTLVYSFEIRLAETGNVRLQDVFQVYFL